MKTNKIIADLRKERSWSQADLANQTDVSQVMIGKYERGDAVPSIEVAKKIADAFGVSLDYLVGEGQNVSFDKKILERIKALQLLEPEKRNTLFDLIDTYIRDFKTRKAYTS
jgi:transcriptional regulator with XRE-family HTH domain